jgi:hypothetical protein
VARTLTKSPVKLGRVALDVAAAALPAYSSRRSRKDFTQHQLFAILVLRQFFKTDYRGVCELLAEFGELREGLDLKKVPHYSTLCHAEKRLLKKGLSTPCFTLYSSAHEP